MTSLRLEQEALRQGYTTIAGVDEAGRGPLAGPVVAAACILPQGLIIDGVDDSKKLSPQKREELYQRLTRDPTIFYGIGLVEVAIIDQINILQATFLAMLQAVNNLPKQPDYLLVDGKHIPKFPIPAKAIIDGDALSHSIAAASIIAKVFRDYIMLELAKLYPQYGFEQHKGYGTAMHMEALNIFGPCPAHRMSFAPVRENMKYET